jgi:hypothetical protein
MKTHHVWWPHLDREPLFNPFVPVTQQRYPASDSERIDSAEEEEQQPTEIQSESEEDPKPSAADE